ncbi:signal peptidase I [Haloechinothrix halophila]|uniref:signal peptidase I n=1 Tax=Haloechinothrix halophila TaxID=1069073 RepID=UPI0004104453|nr:signal peptidase I [Haloechinothrix halophila]
MSDDVTDDDYGDQHEGPDRGRAPRKKRSFWKELPILILVALLLTFVIQQFIARPYMIPSGSMEQTLHGCTGCTPDRVLVDKMVFRFSEPEPGEVVVFRGPESWLGGAQTSDSENVFAGFVQYLGSLVGLAPPDERDFVKRIIALEGQTVRCCDENNRVVVDGEPLEEPYVYFPPGVPREQRTFEPVTVPEGMVWVMGDNRNNSSDSRVNGPVPVDNIIGKARVIVLPPGRWGTVSDYNPQQEASG